MESKSSSRIAIGVIIAIIGAFIALCAWITPFNPIGDSPIIYFETIFPKPTKPPLLFEETFDEIELSQRYLASNCVSHNNGRLRFHFDKALMGESVLFPGQYEKFTLEFDAYPVGEIFDASVNILFLYHDEGWYEIQLFPRIGEVYAFKVIDPNDPGKNIFFANEVSDPPISIGEISTEIKLDVDRTEFSLWVNGEKVLAFSDSNPYLRGGIRIGAGAGGNAGVSIEIDNIEIRGK